MGTYVEITYTVPRKTQSFTWSEWYPGGSTDNGVVLLAAGAQFYGEHPTAKVIGLSTSVGELNTTKV